MIPPKVQLFLR